MGGKRRRPEPLAADRAGPANAQGTESTANEAADLLAAFRDGDPTAFQAIVGAFQLRLVQFFYRLCWDRDRAEDFTQDLFLKLLRGSRNYRPEGKLGTFIFRVATNLWIDHYRASRPQPRMFSLDQVLVEGEMPLAAHAPCEGQSPLQRVVADEERAHLRHAVESLTEPHRIVFELAVFQQLAYAEIGDVLGIPVGTVKSRMHNSVHVLKQMLGAKEGGDTFRRALEGVG